MYKQKKKKKTLRSTEFLQSYKNTQPKGNFLAHLDKYISFSELKTKLEHVKNEQNFEKISTGINKLINKTEKQYTDKQLTKIEVLIHQDEITYVIFVFMQCVELYNGITDLIQKWKK